MQAAAGHDGDPVVVGMEEHRVEVPDILLCPLTHQIMRQPVTATDGHVYEREAIVKHMSVADAVSPFTRGAFGSRDVLVNDAITARVVLLLREHPGLILADEVYCPYSLFLAMKNAVVAKNIDEISRLAMLDVRLLVRSPLEMHSVYWPVPARGLSNRTAFELACELEDATDLFTLQMIRLVQRLYPSYVREHVGRLPDDWNPVSLNRAMHHAAWLGNMGELRLFLDFGAQIESGNKNLHPKDSGKWRALHLAARRGHLATVDLLLDRGAIVAPHENGWSPLHIVVQNHEWDATPSLSWEQRKPILEHLLGSGVNIEEQIAASSSYLAGYGLLHIAAHWLDLDAATFLLDSGIFVDSKTVDGRTALYIVTDGDKGREPDSLLVRKMVALLMSRGANPRARRIPEVADADTRLETRFDDRAFAMPTPALHLKDRYNGIARMIDELHGEQVVEALRRALVLEHVVRAQAEQITLLNSLLAELRPDFRERLGLDVVAIPPPPPPVGVFAAVALAPGAAAPVAGGAAAAGGAGARAP